MKCDVPSNKMLGVPGENQFVWESKMLTPVDDLSVSIGWLFGTEWRPSDKTFKHNSSNRPPIAEIGVSLTVEYLRGNVIRGSNGGVCHSTA